ncbi:MAG: multiprotein bridging factor aMBF1 [Euryarchaeota archaeon]|nr:multiprotein bridging factor aMBF1 [Euryarchaeota archaeon]
MQCEICGSNIRGKAHRVILEGTELNVCDACAKYGHEVKQVPKATAAGTGRTPAGKVSAGGVPAGITFRTGSRRRPDMFDQMTDELLSDYGFAIRRAREARGMSQEELALEIKEKASLLKKLEREDLRPTDGIRKKLERVLGISLTETIE